MWLKLDIRGMKIELQINGYQRSDKDNWDCQWCDVSFSFEFPGCIDYSKMNDEIILSCEVETLERKIDDFINDRITDKETLELIEPDFVFVFKPSYNMLESGEYEYAAPGYEMSNAVMEWKVNLWERDGRLTNNYFSATLDKAALRVLGDYLRLITGKLNKDSGVIKTYINDRVIYGQI